MVRPYNYESRECEACDGFGKIANPSREWWDILNVIQCPNCQGVRTVRRPVYCWKPPEMKPGSGFWII